MAWIRVALILIAIGGLITLPGAARPAAAPEAWDGTPQFSMERGWADVAVLATRFPRRWSGGPDRPAAAEWIAAALRRMGLDVWRDTFPAHLGARAPAVLENVWAISPGTERAGEIVVVVGNYDMAPTSIQAASDTAGHVGTILELARLMATAPHRRTFLFLFPDGEEWGMLGARHFVRTFPERGRIVVALSIEDLDVGDLAALGIDGSGQFRGFAPYWLRGLAADAARLEGVRTDEVSPAFEWVQRSLSVSSTDQGPFLAAGIQAIDLAGRSDDTALKRIVYHLPDDTIEKMRPESVLAYGRIQERILRTLDALPVIPRASDYYLRTAPGRIVPPLPLAIRQMLVFLPLAAALFLRPGGWAGMRPAFAVESLRVTLVFLVLLALVGALKLLPVVGALPRYALYPPPPRHPLLTAPQAVPLLIAALALIGLSVAARAVLRRAPGGRHEMDAHATSKRVAVLLLWLLAVALIALADNPFGAVMFLTLPAVLWIWISPDPAPLRRTANGLLVLGGFLVVALLFAQYGATLRVGGYIFWYVFLALAYAQFTPLQIVLTCATLAVGIRLLALATLGRVRAL
jgi:Peptidase family M28